MKETLHDSKEESFKEEDFGYKRSVTEDFNRRRKGNKPRPTMIGTSTGTLTYNFLLDTDQEESGTSDHENTMAP